MRDAFEAAARKGEAPVLVTSAHIRPFVRGEVETLPLANAGDVAERNPPARATQIGAVHS